MTKPIDSLDDLVPDSENPNPGSERTHAIIRGSLEKRGFGRSLVADKNGKVIIGNQTLDVLSELDMREVVVVPTDGKKVVIHQRTDLDLDNGDDARLLSYEDNRSTDFRKWDPSVLKSHFDRGLPVSNLLFKPAEKDKLVGGLPADPSYRPDAELRVDESDQLLDEWDPTPGDIWSLGRHRLLVGDSTDPDQVSRLMGSERAGLLVTDPPYGVDYAAIAKDRHFSMGKTHTTYATTESVDGDKLSPEEMGKLLRDSFAAAPLAENAALYYWYPSGRESRPFLEFFFDDSLRLLFHNHIVWVKEKIFPGRTDYKWQHESCFYGWRQGYRPPFYGVENNQSTVWEVPRENAVKFPTQKPVELYRRPILNHLLEGELVFDGFAGSGTVIIAAEQTGRTARAVEQNRRNAALILQRYYDATGDRPVRVDD